MVYWVDQKLSTKVISAKISSEDYDKLLEACNNKGCSISEFVRERCLEGINPSLQSESKEEKSENIVPNEIEKLQNKNFFLELELSLLKDKLKKKENELTEFLELFSPQEVMDQRIHRSFQKVKIKNCFTL